MASKTRFNRQHAGPIVALFEYDDKEIVISASVEEHAICVKVFAQKTACIADREPREPLAQSVYKCRHLRSPEQLIAVSVRKRDTGGKSFSCGPCHVEPPSPLTKRRTPAQSGGHLC